MAIRNLALAARTTIDGFMAGINKSKVKGPGLEFSQYRSYQAGDDLRWMDWKMYARSDRYYIRESEIETSVSVRFVMDASASMLHEDDGISKIDYARYIIASLAWLAHLQGDSVGMYVCGENGLYALPSRNDHQHMWRLYHQLEQVAPGGKMTNPVHFKEILAGSNRRELVMVVTDLYQESDEIYRLLDTFSTLKHEVMVLHIMGANEMQLRYEGYATLEDLETGAVMDINANQLRKEYDARLQEWLSAARMAMLDRNIAYRLVVMDEPVDQLLRDFLKQRNRTKA
ncbi:DUF58 domain-containing protein [Sediminibacterium sp. WSJ-3]|nr:DUF58 domain-containing protein [Sediminibacterium soli]